MFPDDRDQFAKFKLAAKPIYALVSCMDSMFLLRRGLSELMTPQATKAKVYDDKGIVELGGLSDLYSNAILDPGAIIGLWEYDSKAAFRSAWVVPRAALQESKRFAKHNTASDAAYSRHW